MKKIAFYFLAAMLLGLYSCSKENEIEQDFNQTSSLKVQNDNGMDYKVVDGILHFETPDAFYNLSEYLMNMSEDEFEAWEIENDFISLQSELLDVNKSLDNCQTAEDFEKIITENSDIIAISEDRIVPVVDSDFYTRIANRRGYFVAEGYLQKITNSGLYFCKDLCFEEIEKAFNGIETEIVEHYNFDLKQELKSAGSTSGTMLLYNIGGWYDNRRCTATMRITNGSYATSDFYYYKYFFDSFSDSEKKVLWYSRPYESAHNTSGFTVRIQVPNKVVSPYPGWFEWDYNTVVLSQSSYGPSNDCERKYYHDNEPLMGDYIKESATVIRLCGGPAVLIKETNAKFWTRGSTSSYPAELVCSYN